MSTALELKALGNKNFQHGDFPGAEAEYTAALDELEKEGVDVTLQVTLLSNRAACRHALGNVEGAVGDARKAIQKDLFHLKSYFRLCKLLLEDVKLPEARRAVFIAVSLSRGKIDPALTTLYNEIRSVSVQDANMWMPESTNQFCLVHPGMGSISRALGYTRDNTVVCALPGKYTDSVQLNSNNHYALVGIGDVQVDQAPFSTHTLYINNAASIFVSGITFIGGRQEISQAAIALCHGRTAIFHNCHVSKYAGAGLLAAEPATEARLQDCTFKDLPRMAIEVREGASLHAERVEACRCRQGISAYGGAEKVDILKCLISECSLEGMLLSGTFQNATTRRQLSLEDKGELNQAQATTEAAVQWAISRGIQMRASITETTVRGCGQFGLSIDYGAQISVHASTLVHNDPSGIQIKGGSDLSIAASRVEYTGGKSKSPITSQLASKGHKNVRNVIKQSGIVTAINYSGTVVVSSCVTVGLDPALGIVNEMDDHDQGKHIQMKMMLGFYTKPPRVVGCAHFRPDDTTIPTIADLVASLPSSLKKMQPIRQATSVHQQHLSNLRPLHRLHQDASWSPTKSQYYAIGNTPGHDLTATAAFPTSVDHLRILLGACGDIRNLLWTVAAIPANFRIDVFVNDGNLAMLARNAVMLQMIASNAPTEHILAVWANHELKDEENKSMMAAITSLMGSPWPNWLSATNKLERNNSSGSVEHKLRDVFQAWAACGISSKHVMKKRTSVLNATSNAKMKVLDLTKKAVGAKLFSKHKAAISAYLSNGSLMSKGTQPSMLKHLNVTLLLPELQYAVYWTSSIFRAIALDETPSNDCLDTLLTRTLEPRFKRLSSALNTERCSVTLVYSDILSALTNRKGNEVFDFIDCTNVTDYVSLPALVQAGALRLNSCDHARFFMESIVMFNLNNASTAWKTARSFVEAMFGYELSNIESLIGIRLLKAEDPPRLVGAGGIRLEFAPINLVTLRERKIDWPQLCAELSRPMSLNLYARISKVDSNAPAAYTSPMTLVHLLATCVPPKTADIILQTVQRCGKENWRLHDWEVQTQVAFQYGLDASEFFQFKYNSTPSPTVFLNSSAVVLAFSKEPLSGPSIHSNEIVQLLGGFAWDGEMYSAEFLLLKKLVGEHRMNSYVTLLFLDESGLSVASASQPLSSLPRQLVISVPDQRWRAHELAASRKPITGEDIDKLNRLNSCAFCKAVSSCNRCARCREVQYCSKNCQIRDWKQGHKAQCRPVT